MSANWKNKQRSRYFFSYMGTALLVVFLVMGILYSHTTKLVRNQLIALAQSAVQAQQRALDYVFLEMEQIALQIDADPALSNYRITQPGYDAYQGMLQLQRYRAANSFFSEIAFLFPDGRILSAAGTFTLSEFNRRYLLPDIFEVHRILSETPMPQQSILYPVSASNRLLIALPLPHFGYPKARMLMFIVDKSQLDNLFASTVSGENDNISILDPTGKILYRYRGQTALRASDSTSRAASEIIPISYEYQLDVQHIGQSFSDLNTRFIQIILAAIVAVWAVADIMSRRQYAPVRHLLDLLPKKNDDTPHELADVEQYIRNMMESNRALAQQMQDYSRVTHDYVLEQLFLGKLSPIDAHRLMQSIGMQFPSAHFTVFRFLFSAVPHTENIGNMPSARIDLAAALSTAADVFGCAESLVWSDASVVLILNHDPGLTARTVFHHIRNALGETANLTGGSSRPFDDLTHAQFALYEAVSASELAHFTLSPFLTAQELEAQTAGNKPIEMSNQAELIEAIRQNNRPEITRLLDESLSTWQQSQTDLSNLHIQTIRLLRNITSLSLALSPPFFQAALHDLMGNNTLASYRQTLEVLCYAAADALSAQHAMEDDPLLARVKDFVEKHYEDPMLGVQRIAENLHMSASYLTRYMRSQADITPSKYIEKVRMQKAKELLTGSDLQIKAVTLQVGYNDASSFVRKFKAETGYTPAQFREASRKTDFKGE